MLPLLDAAPHLRMLRLLYTCRRRLHQHKYHRPPRRDDRPLTIAVSNAT